MEFKFSMNVHMFADMFYEVFSINQAYVLGNLTGVWLSLNKNDTHILACFKNDESLFYYNAPTNNAIVQCVDKVYDRALTNVHLLMDNNLLLKLKRKFKTDTYYNVTYTVNDCGSNYMCKYTIHSGAEDIVLNYKAEAFYVEDKQKIVSKLQQRYKKWMMFTKKNGAAKAQKMDRDQIQRLVDFHNYIPFVMSTQTIQPYIFTNEYMYACQGATCVRKRCEGTPFGNLIQDGVWTVSDNALECLVKLGYKTYWFTKYQDGNNTMSVETDGANIGYLWCYDDAKIKEHMQIVEHGVSNALGIKGVTLSLAELHELTRSGLCKNARVSDGDTLRSIWKGKLGTDIGVDGNVLRNGDVNKVSVDAATIVKDAWGLPPRVFVLYKLQNVVRVLQAFKAKQVRITAAEYTNMITPVLFCTDNADLCIMLCPLRPQRD